MRCRLTPHSLATESNQYMKEQKLAGVVLPLFSLRRNNDHGIGDLTALRQWIDWAAEAHVGFLQLLPVNALGRDDCPSPYSAISSVALEPLYISLEPWTVPGLEERVFRKTEEAVPWQQPAGPDLVDYPKTRAWKMWVLRGAWANFHSKPEYENIRAQFRTWVNEQGSWLEDFACFQVLCDLFGSEVWWQWPEQDAVRARLIASDYEEEKDFCRWLQWVCDKQWSFIRSYADERNVKLMGDIPIGVSMASADVFFERHLFDTAWCGGAPAEGNYAADPFTAKWGQNWGVPLYRWDIMARDDFAWWRRRVKACTRIFSMYRIDHILGFYRIYAFPWKPTENDVFLPMSHEQAAAVAGGRLPGFKPYGDDSVWERNHNLADGDLYLRVLISAAPGVAVVGEDLGCVPDYVRPNMRQLNIPGFKIPHWEIKENGKITLGSEYHECSFAAFATHDFETVIQTWNDCYAKIEKAVKNGLWQGDAPAKSCKPGQEGILKDAEDGARLLKWFADYCHMDVKTWLSPWNDEIKTAMYTALYGSNSRYAAMLWPALFDINKRLNVPGTVGGTNWRERMPFKGADAEDMPQTAWLRDIIDAAGRTPLQGEDAIKAFKDAALRVFPKVRVNNDRFLKGMFKLPGVNSERL